MGRRIEASGRVWLVRLDGRADRLRNGVNVSRPTPPLEREATEGQQGEQAAQQRQGDPEARRPWLEVGGDQRHHETHDPRREPDRDQRAGEHRHPEPAVQHRLAIALAEAPDESAPEERAVAGGVAIVEDDAVAADPAVQSRRVPRPAVDRGFEPRPGFGGRAAAGEGHRPHGRSSPRNTVTACPARTTRSPASRTRITPPRGEAWYAVISVRSSRS